MNRALAAAPLPDRDEAAAANLPIVYIVGAPRSGTTLLSQVLSRYLRVGYIDNLIARFWLRPSVGITLSRILLGESGRDAIAFDSRHGVTSGSCRPARVWQLLAALAGARSCPDPSPGIRRARGARRRGTRSGAARRDSGAFRLPVVFKNVICGFQAAWLTAVHPRSLFVHIDRELESTCKSFSSPGSIDIDRMTCGGR